MKTRLFIIICAIVTLSGCAGIKFDPSRMDAGMMNASANYFNPNYGYGMGARAPITCQQQGPYTRCW